MTTKSSELLALRRDLARHERGRGRRYHPELRERVAAWARPRVADGASWHELARQLGLRVETLQSWCPQPMVAPAIPTRLLPVRVVPEPTSPSALRVVSPSGFRVEGLSLTQAVAVLRMLA